MTKEFVPYGLAVKLKELGFNEPCFGYRDGIGHLMIKETPHGGISAPTYSQAFRWFREKYGLCGHIKPENNEDDIIAWEYVILTIVDDFAGVANASEVCFTTRKSNYTTYEEAELACLKKLIEIVKPK